MSTHVYCRNCRHEIEPQRLSHSVVVCQVCGQTYSHNMREESRQEFLATIKFMALGLFGLFIFLAQIHKYDTAFITVIPLQLKHLVKMDNKQDNLKLVEICKSVKKYSCVEDVLKRATKKHPADTDLLEQYAATLYYNKKLDLAAERFEAYFNMNGKSPDAGYLYALTLQKLNNIKKAESMYKWTLSQKKDVLQLSVTENYVKMLMANGNFTKAKGLIRYIRRKATNAHGFMEKELNEMKSSRKVASRSKK